MRLAALRNRYSGVLEAIAECDECDWVNENRKNALATASVHARRTGHQVHAVQTVTVTYNRTEGIPHKLEYT